MTPESPSVSNSLAKIIGERPWRSADRFQETALRISEAANHDLTYEKKRGTQSRGTDGAFPKNRINLAFAGILVITMTLSGVCLHKGLNGTVISFRQRSCDALLRSGFESPD